MITVRSPRGASVQVGSFLPTTVRKIALIAAVDLGYSPHGVYTLADPSSREALPYDAPSPETGEWEIVDGGGDV